MHNMARPLSVEDVYSDETPAITEQQLELIKGFFQIHKYSSVWISRHLGIDFDSVQAEIQKLKSGDTS